MRSADNIVQLLRESEEPIASQFDEETLRDVFAAMDESIGERPGGVWRVIRRMVAQAKLTRIAATVVLLGTTLFLIYHIASRQLTTEDSQGGSPESSRTAAEIRLEQELELAAHMFTASDMPGLLSLLETGLDRSKSRAAKYLEQVGDASALATLQPLADQWTDSSQVNPFARAIEAIRAREVSAPGQIEPNRSVETLPPPVQTYQFEPQGVLSGLITDAQTGDPVVGARVEAYVRRVFRTKTDENGFYSFDEVQGDGNYKIRITSRTHLSPGAWPSRPAVAVTAEGQTVKHFQLERGCRVRVNLIDEAGRPVAGARVAASWLGAERGKKDLGEARSDANGVAIVGAVEPSDLEYRLIARHQKYAPGFATLRLNAPTLLARAEIVLTAGVEVVGYAEFADGVPAEGIQIYAQPDWWHSNYLMNRHPVDANGMFTLKRVISGVHSIHAYFENSEGGGNSFPLTQAQLPDPGGELLSLRIPKKSPQSLVSIRGSIDWASEQRPSSIWVLATSSTPGLPESRRMRGDLSSFEIDSLEPGRYTLRFSGSDLRTIIVRNVQAPSDDLKVTLEYQGKPHLTGSVVHAETHQTIARFRARMIQVKHLNESYNTPPANWYQFTSGKFDLEAPGPGVYRVQIMAKGFAPTLSEEINTDDFGPATLQLTAGGRLHGQVVNSAGEPVSGAKVIPLSTAKGNTPTLLTLFVTEEGAVQTVNGSFLFEHLSPGVESFKIVHPDYAPELIEGIEIREDATTDEVKIVLDRGATIEGLVYDTEGKPEANVTLFVQDEKGHNVPTSAEPTRLGIAVTDANGFYRVDRLPAGRLCHLTRKDEFQTMGVVHRACVPNAAQTTRLDFGAGPSLTGTLHREGVPLLNTRVRLGTPHLYYSRVFRCSGITDGFGRFKLPGVLPGRYGIYHEKPGRRGQWVLIAVVEVGQEDMDLGVIPKETARLQVTLRSQDPEADLSLWRIHVQQNSELWGSRPGEVSVPTSPGGPMVVKGLIPGNYQIVASRDGTNIRRKIQLESGRDLVEVNLNLPVATASVAGMLQAPASQSLILWSDNSTALAFLAREGEAYGVDHLPAGSYLIGDRLLRHQAPIAAFSLVEGEAKTLDIDLTDWSPNVAVVVVSVAGQDGSLLSQADIWLEGTAEPIEPILATGDAGATFIVAPDDYVLSVACEGYQSYRETLSLTTTKRQGPSFKKVYRTAVLTPQ